MTEALNSPVYVDANPFIYFIEGDDALSASMRSLFETLKARPGLAVTSELTLAEVLPKAAAPLRRAYMDLIIWSGTFDLRPVTREILVETARYRRASVKIEPDGRESMVKLPDAIHVVTAIHCECRRVVSDDAQLRLPPGYERVACDPVGISKLLEALR